MNTVIKTVPAIPVLFRRDRLTIPRVPAHAGPAIESLMDALRRAAVEPAGPVIFVYYGIEANPTQEFDLDICVPTAAETAIPTQAPIGCKMLGTFSALPPTSTDRCRGCIAPGARSGRPSLAQPRGGWRRGSHARCTKSGSASTRQRM